MRITPLGNGQQAARARTLFRKFIDSTATVTISKHGIGVRFGRRAHNPMMINARSRTQKPETVLPWLENLSLRLHFGG